jgi:hypothetical protein
MFLVHSVYDFEEYVSGSETSSGKYPYVIMKGSTEAYSCTVPREENTMN